MRAVVSYWRKNVHELLVHRLGGLSLPRKSAVRLTDRPNMTLDVYRGRKITTKTIVPPEMCSTCITLDSFRSKMLGIILAILFVF